MYIYIYISIQWVPKSQHQHTHTHKHMKEDTRTHLKIFSLDFPYINQKIVYSANVRRKSCCLTHKLIYFWSKLGCKRDTFLTIYSAARWQYSFAFWASHTDYCQHIRTFNCMCFSDFECKNRILCPILLMMRHFKWIFPTEFAFLWFILNNIRWGGFYFFFILETTIFLHIFQRFRSMSGHFRGTWKMYEHTNVDTNIVWGDEMRVKYQFIHRTWTQTERHDPSWLLCPLKRVASNKKWKFISARREYIQRSVSH